MYQNLQYGGFDEARLVFLLKDLDAHRNVGCALKELSKMKIPETTARNFNVLERVAPFEHVPTLDKLVAIIIRKDKKMKEVNRHRRVKFAEKKAKKMDSEVVDPNIGFSSNEATRPTEFPLKGGPGLDHSAFSPFRVVIPKDKTPTPILSTTTTSVLELPYVQKLYQQVVMETSALTQTTNPTVDQVLEEMNQMNGASFLLRF